MITAILGVRGFRVGRPTPAAGLSRVSTADLAEAAGTVPSEFRAALGEFVVRVSTFAIASRPVDVVLPGGFVTERWRPIRGLGVVSDDVHELASWGAVGKALGVPLRVAVVAALTPAVAAACLAASIDEVWVGTAEPLGAADPELDAEPFRRLERLGPVADARERALLADGAADPWRTALAIVGLASGGRPTRLVTTSRQLFEALPAQLGAALPWPSAGALDPRLDSVILQLAPGVEVALAHLAGADVAELHVTGARASSKLLERAAYTYTARRPWGWTVSWAPPRRIPGSSWCGSAPWRRTASWPSGSARPPVRSLLRAGTALLPPS